MPPKAKDTDEPDSGQQAATTPAWLTELEATVRRTTEEIRRLREENRTLRSRAEELEKSLAAARKEHAKELEDGSDDEASAAWREERDEIRGRVERLTGKLESLLEQASENDEDDESEAEDADGSSSD